MSNNQLPWYITHSRLSNDMYADWDAPPKFIPKRPLTKRMAQRPYSNGAHKTPFIPNEIRHLAQSARWGHLYPNHKRQQLGNPLFQYIKKTRIDGVWEKE